MRESVEAKAARLLVAGALSVVEVVPGGRVRAVVDGDHDRYHVVWEAGEWSCSCPARGACSHLEALRLVVRGV